MTDNWDDHIPDDEDSGDVIPQDFAQDDTDDRDATPEELRAIVAGAGGVLVSSEPPASDAEVTGRFDVQRINETQQVRVRRDDGGMIDRLEPVTRDEPTVPRVVPPPVALAKTVPVRNGAEEIMVDDGTSSGLELEAPERPPEPMELANAWHSGKTGMDGPPPSGQFDGSIKIEPGGFPEPNLLPPVEEDDGPDLGHAEFFDEPPRASQPPVAKESWFRSHIVIGAGVFLASLVVLVLMLSEETTEVVPTEIPVAQEDPGTPELVPPPQLPPDDSPAAPERKTTETTVAEPETVKSQVVPPQPKLPKDVRKVEVEKPKPRKRKPVKAKKAEPPCNKKNLAKTGETKQQCCDRVVNMLMSSSSPAFFSTFDSCVNSSETWTPPKNRGKKR